MEQPKDYFDAWIKAQQQAFATLREQSLLMQSMFQDKTTDNPFASWSKAVMQAFTSSADAGLAKDIFGKALYSGVSLQKLYELWQPLLNAMRDKSLDPASYSQYADPEKLQALISKLFNFDLDAMAQMQKQAKQYADWYEQYGKPWADAMKTQMAGFSLGELQPEAWLKQLQAMSGMFSDNASKLFSVPAIGKDREKIELFSRWAKAVADFAAANLEYQNLLQSTGQQAMQDVVQALAAKLKAGEQVDQFGTFFNLWIETSEQAFHKLFQNKPFAHKRNAMSEAGFKARKLYHELIESQLADYPIARRSEMDELYKVIYDLRKQVKQLQAQLKGGHHE